MIWVRLFAFLSLSTLLRSQFIGSSDSCRDGCQSQDYRCYRCLKTPQVRALRESSILAGRVKLGVCPPALD